MMTKNIKRLTSNEKIKLFKTIEKDKLSVKLICELIKKSSVQCVKAKTKTKTFACAFDRRGYCASS